MAAEPEPADREAAERLLAKLRVFIAEQLDEEEAELLAALVAPGVAWATADEDVVGFDADAPWRPRDLPEGLAEAVRSQGIRVEGLAEE